MVYYLSHCHSGLQFSMNQACLVYKLIDSEDTGNIFLPQWTTIPLRVLIKSYNNITNQLKPEMYWLITAIRFKHKYKLKQILSTMSFVGSCFVCSCFLVIFLCGHLSAQYQYQGKCRNMITDKRRLSQGLATTHPQKTNEVMF